MAKLETVVGSMVVLPESKLNARYDHLECGHYEPSWGEKLKARYCSTCAFNNDQAQLPLW